MIQKERIKPLNQQSPANRRFVLYWMQASQRAEYNHALEYAIDQANALKKPLLVYFGVTDAFPEANARHYYFMLQGLNEVKAALNTRGIKFLIQRQSPEVGIIELARHSALVVVDAGYLKIQRQWRQIVAERIDCPLIQVESDVIVPVATASTKENFSAATLRPRIKRHLPFFIKPLATRPLDHASLDLDIDWEPFDISNIAQALLGLDIDHSVAPVTDWVGGTVSAKQCLADFINHKLDHYAELRNDPGQDNLSRMSPFLHFGQISTLFIALEVLESNSPGMDSYLEELIVRRELSMNFCYYNPKYDSLDGLPAWAHNTLTQHQRDPREFIYELPELEQAQTHDPYWNAAQQEMVLTGKMHGYMRMYWGKKILEWSRTLTEAFQQALYLNNKYELDGRDPNAFTGVAWCFGKHDRAWSERDIFGKVRYMNANGLKRKFDMATYVEKIKKLEA